MRDLFWNIRGMSKKGVAPYITDLIQKPLVWWPNQKKGGFKRWVVENAWRRRTLGSKGAMKHG
jgi:hypothetical protein